MTLVERVICLLSQSQLPRSFLGEALGTVVHVMNLTPCVTLGFEVPNMIWSEKAISYGHLRVFGCKAFVHILKDERSKLDARRGHVCLSAMIWISSVTSFMIQFRRSL